MDTFSDRAEGAVGSHPSFWLSQVDAVAADPLLGDARVDVCIVGGGLTGLWTAFYLKRALPDAQIVVLEKEYAGYGASGRNAGWLSSEFNGRFDDLADRGGPGAVTAMHDAMCATVDEVIAVCRAEAIDADMIRSGIIRLAQNEAQLQRLRAAYEARHRWNVDKGYSWLSGPETLERVHAGRALGAEFTEFGARVHPGKLVRGLLSVVRRIGVRVHESTEVVRLDRGQAITRSGIVRAPVILRCLEAYTRDLQGHRRDWLPMHSSLVITPVLAAEIWDQLGWDGCELLADGANVYAAGQRTADGRIAMGGRGMMPRYRIGSRLDHRGQTNEMAVRTLAGAIHSLFPQLKPVPLAAAWCGVLAIPRDWSPTVTFDASAGVGWAGGYVGSGVSTANLAGRTLTDLVTGTRSELTRLPWVSHAQGRWEPEPIRWLGVRSMSVLFYAADRRESARLRRTSKLAALAATVSGRVPPE